MTELSAILLVDDDKLIRQTMRERLEKDDFLVIEAANGKRSIEILKQYMVNLVLLDLNLPDAIGLEYITSIRCHTSAPLLIVSGEPDNDKKIQCMQAGADDFISKPINIDMLIAKMHAHIRRFKNPFLDMSDLEIGNKVESSVKFDKWEIDLQKFQIFDANKNSADLTAHEFRLLNILVTNAGRAVPRDELCEAVRDKNYIPSPRSIDIKITRIRKKIGDNAAHPTIIKTIRSVGYMFDKNNLIS